MKFKFVFVSKDSEFKIQKNQFDNISNVETIYFDNNRLALSKIYNKVLNEDKNSDFILLAHSDVLFNISEVMSQLEATFGKYDLLGFCGCSKISVGQSPLNWYCGSIPFPEYRWGCVTHGEIGNQTSFFSAHHPNITDHEVSCIDGLCIIFTRKAIDSGLRFDENLSPFDFYDTDISLQAILKYNLKIGVLVRKELQHWSIGKSILTPEFIKNEDIFRNKWKFEKTLK